MAAASRVGTRFGPYQLTALLGKGGMGEVYEAFDTVKSRTVALKLLPEEYAQNPGYPERFRREAHAAARLQEPHVIPIHDWGEIDGVLYIDMRLVQGADLRALLKSDGALRPARAVLIISQIANALDAAHASGLVHRDVKPENILISGAGDSDFAYLVDFGIASDAQDAKLTTLGATVGTFAYMAPERFDEGIVTGRADTYSLACVLHEILTGAKPYQATSVSALIMAHLTADPPRPSRMRRGIPSGFDGVIARGMAKDPAHRYASSGELARAARTALASSDPDAANTISRRIAPTAMRPPGPKPDYPQTALQRATEREYAPPQQLWHPAQPYPNAAPVKSSSSAVPILITLLIVGLLALGAVVGWLVLGQNKSDDTTIVSTGATAPVSSKLTSPPASATPTSTDGTPAPTDGTPTPIVAPLPPIVGSVSGTDEQGFLAPSSARCDSTNPAVTIGRTAKSLVVVCETGVGRYYYKGVRISDGLGISLDDPVPTGSGFTVTNAADGTRYKVTASSLTIVDAQGKILASEPMIEYAHR